VESCTAIAEHHDGRLEIITWTQISQEDDSDEDGPLAIQAA
jgi:hypothetical protein